jgi:hypothetical protein
MIPLLYLATPAKTLEPEYVDALNGTLRHLRKLGIKSMGPDIQSGGWTALARNECCFNFEHSPADLLLFLDSDLWWRPEDVVRLFQHGQNGIDIIGAHYPKKELEWWRIGEKSLEDLRDPERVKNVVSRGQWPHREIGPRVEDCVEVDYVPTGFLLLSRDALSTYRERYETKCGKKGALHYWSPGVLEPRTEFFRYLVDEESVMLGEDIAFCRTARGLGLKIYKLLDTEIRHVGKVVF